VVPPTPVPVTAHTFPETPIRPFDELDFIDFLGRVRDSFRSYDSEMGQMIQDGKPGDCGTFIGFIWLWVLEAPGYTDVPAQWNPLYVEYRGLLRDVVTLSEDIRALCAAEGGTITQETLQAIVDFLAFAYPRSEQMVVEAVQLRQ
jgi:hypothetical protein